MPIRYTCLSYLSTYLFKKWIDQYIHTCACVIIRICLFRISIPSFYQSIFQVTTIVIRIGFVQLRGSKGLALAHIAWRRCFLWRPKWLVFQSGLHIPQGQFINFCVKFCDKYPWLPPFSSAWDAHSLAHGFSNRGTQSRHLSIKHEDQSKPSMLKRSSCLKKLFALHMGHWHQRTGYLRMWHERFQSESHESHCSLKSSATKAFRNSSNKTSSWPVNNAAIAAASQPVVGMAHCKITHLCATQNRLHLSGLRGIIRPFGEPLRY